MKNIRTKLAAIIMTGFLMAGTTFAKGGLLLSDLRGEQAPQTCPQVDKGILMSDATGIIITGFTGIIITGFTGIIITGALETKGGCQE